MFGDEVYVVPGTLSDWAALWRILTAATSGSATYTAAITTPTSGAKTTSVPVVATGDMPNAQALLSQIRKISGISSYGVR